MTTFNVISLLLAAAGIVTFSRILVHAARALKAGAVPSTYLSRSHARRRVASSLLIVFALLWLLVGMTLLRKTIFSAERPLLALVFLIVLALDVLSVLALAWLDFREANRAYRENFSRSRKEEIREVIRDAVEEYRRENPPPPPAPSDN